MRFNVRTILASTALCATAVLGACSGDDDSNSPQAVPPTNVVATATSSSSVTVTFTAAQGATGYLIERATGSDGEFRRVTSSPISATTFTDVNLTPASTYRYRVASVRGTETSAFTAATQVSTLGIGNAIGTLTGNITANRTLFRDTLYQLNGYVKVQSGATLTIQPGTRILGGNAGGVGGALFIYQGAKLIADGTRELPIVFTSSRADGSRAPGDWGGIVIVGRAATNRTSAPVLIEAPAETQVQYNNGTDDNDDSGTLRYVRVEFAGFAVSADNELNSLSLYALGRNTDFEYVQTLAGLDDAFEWFGGTMDGRYLVSYETQDDHFDFSEGYRGRNQFMIALQTTTLTPNPGGSAGGPATDPQIFEGDGCNGAGCVAGFSSTPFTMPVFANFTVIGRGTGGPAGGGNGLFLRRGVAGTFVNGIVARMPNRAITVIDTATSNRIATDSLSLRNLFLVENAANFDPVGADTVSTGTRRFGQAARFAGRGVDTATTGTTTLSLFTTLFPTGGDPTGVSLNFTPAAGAPAEVRTGGLTSFPAPLAGRMNSFFGGALFATSYRGAVNPDGSNQWYTGWTLYDRN